MINLLRSGLPLRNGQRIVQNKLSCCSRNQINLKSTSSNISPDSPCDSISNNGSISSRDTKTAYQTTKQTHQELSTTEYNSEQCLIPSVPLSEGIPWTFPPVYSTATDLKKYTRVTTLDNGIRVASEPMSGSHITIGVLLDSGSRYELPFISGISHFLEKMAFGDTINMRGWKISDFINEFGGSFECKVSRDNMIYSASMEGKSMEEVVEILSEVVWRPHLHSEELATAKHEVICELDNLSFSQKKDQLLLDKLHNVAYDGKTVGLPMLCPRINVGLMNVHHLMSYLKSNHRPDRLVVAGVGVEHDQLVRAVEQFFVISSSSWDQWPDVYDGVGPREVDMIPSCYTGGVWMERGKPATEDEPAAVKGVELCHLAMGLQSVHIQHPDHVVCSVLQLLLGGASTLNIGGPATALNTRLCNHVVNKQEWVYSATTHNLAYRDTGLFCVLACCKPSHLADLTLVISDQFRDMVDTVTQEEMLRCKRHLQRNLLRSLQSSTEVMEDMARQVVRTGMCRQPQYFIDVIDRITLDDVRRVASNLLQSKLSVAAYAPSTELLSYQDIEAALLDQSARLKPRSHFIRAGFLTGRGVGAAYTL